MTDVEPTAIETANAEARAAIAAKQNAVFDDAQALADAALGNGYHPWMALHLIDADHRRNGNIQPVATVFKVYRGEKKLTERSVYIRKMPDGTVQTAASFEPLFGDLLTEKHATRTIEIKGQPVPVGRYELCWSSLERYEPKSAAELAALRASRERKAEERAVAKAVEENPLFREQILSGDLRPEKRRARS